MADIQVTYAQLAQVALTTMAGASVPADDRTLALVQGTRNFLRQIADGTLGIFEVKPQETANQGIPETPVRPAPTNVAPRPAHTRRRPGPAKASDGVRPPLPPTMGNGMRGMDGVVPESITGAPRREH